MIEAKQSLVGELNYGIKTVSPSLIDLEVTPSKETQTFKHEGSYGYDNVVVNAMPSEYIVPNGTKDINSNGVHNVNEYENVNVLVEPSLQQKEVNPTKTVQTITPDTNYYGLSKVTVNAIPDEYIVPSGDLNITENGTYDVTNVVNANVNVPTGGPVPTKGFVIDEWTTDGYAKKVTVYGLTSIGSYMFDSYNTTVNNLLTKYLEEVVLPDSVTFINSHAFRNANKITTMNLDNVKSFSNYAMMNCAKLNIKTLNNAETLIQCCFSACDGITQLSMPKLKLLQGSGSSSSAFVSCRFIQAVWIGADISANQLPRYAFVNSTQMKKIFIDLPRATVESWSDYQYAFMNNTSKTGIIVCNDDAEFITKEEFDAIDWSTV